MSFPLDRGICELLTEVPEEKTMGARFLLALFQEDALELAPMGTEAVGLVRDLLRKRLADMLGSG